MALANVDVNIRQMLFCLQFLSLILRPQLSPSFAHRPRVVSDVHTDLRVDPFHPSSFIYLFLHLCSPGYGVTIVTRRGRAEGQKMKMKGARTAVIRLSPSLALWIRLLLSPSAQHPLRHPLPSPTATTAVMNHNRPTSHLLSLMKPPHAEIVEERKGTVRPVRARIPP